jgi:diaminohydroxyphosphoribosylaminopyrimidine deaminase/5-amino-6-(5-phosphoribosylamino)uracil reductase
LNRRFITAMEHQRPYIILKWAQSADGYLDDRGRTARITSAPTDVLVHRWRSREQAILVGSRTVLNDNPSLTVRHVEGRHPLRILIDRKNTTHSKASIFDSAAPTLLITSARRNDIACDQLVLRSDANLLELVLKELDRRGIQSLLVEGGAELHGHFMSVGLWDEARVITGAKSFGDGTVAPRITIPEYHTLLSGSDRIAFFNNTRGRFVMPGNVEHA